MANIRVNQDRLALARAFVDEIVYKGVHPNGFLTVANSKEIVLSHIAAKEDKLQEDSLFLLASITKTVLGVAIMRLVERGKLLLNQPVARYIPEFGKNGKSQVTTWHLLTHSSGLNEQIWSDLLASKDIVPSPELGVQAACDSFLNFPAGERCEYCTLSFAILGELVQRLSGKSYSDYLREEIFEPLGMESTAFTPVDWDRALQVHNFGKQDFLAEFSKLAMPGAGLWSSAGDLVRYGQTLLAGGRSGDYQLLSTAAFETMTRLQTQGLHEITLAGSKAPYFYALGWGKPSPYGDVIGSAAAFGHGGITGTYFWVDPEWDLVFVFLTNSWEIGTELPRQILNTVYSALERH